MNQAYESLLARVREVRELANRCFGQALAAWSPLPNVEPGLIPVERILADVVAPLASVRPVLVILMDGLDLVVWRQLWTGLSSSGWTSWQPPGESPTPPVGIAVLPSATAFSRASLFAGKVKGGSQTTEKPDFAAHPALAGVSIPGRPPLLWHKGDLVDPTGGGLSDAVRQSIADRKQRVVAAVINAADDWLDKSDQILPRWAVERVPLLGALLQEGSNNSRVVVVLSDHGHVLEYQTTLRAGGEGARWRRPESGPLNDDEILVKGSRLSAATGLDAVVLPWSEAVRYTPRKAGYHGGASPQEVIAPIAVLSTDDLGVEGWRPVLDAPPTWWEDVVMSATEVPVSVDVPESAPMVAPSVPQTRKRVARVRPTAPPEWIARLLASPVYALQRELAGRTAPPDEQMQLVLTTLDQYRGRAPRAALSAAVRQPELRLRGLMAGVRRVLNVDGFGVIEEEEGTGSVTLNRSLLLRQFGLDR